MDSKRKGTGPESEGRVNELEDRMKKRIADARLNGLELAGFAKNLELALLCGCAMGYGMAVEDMLSEKDKQVGA